VVADGRVALSFVFAGSTQRDVLVDEHVVADLGGLANDNAHTVVDKNATADLGAGVDVNAGQGAINLRQKASGKIEAGAIHTVRKTVEQYGMKAGVAEDDFEDALSGRVFLENGIDLLPDGTKHRLI